MKRILSFITPFLALSMMLIGCKPDEITPDGPDTGGAKVVGTFKQADIVAAASELYDVWIEDASIAETMTVGTTELTRPQYLYAIAKTFIDINAGSSADVEVLSYKMAEHPERDSYDQMEIAVKNGPKNGENTEDLLNVATRLLADMAEKGQVPNQTLFERAGKPIAFSVNRSTVTLLRVLAEYKPQGKLPEKVSAEFLSTSATLKGFASQFVKYLEIWENTVADYLSADGSHNSGSNTAFENVHFVPIPYSGGYPDGEDQYHNKYRPYHEIEVAGTTYTAAQCWGIALKGILDLCTLEGSTVWETERTPDTPAHTLGNGKSLNAPIPQLEEWFIWGSYPWYENENDGGAVKYNGEEIEEVDIAFLVRLFPWHLTRSSQLAAIGNFQQFGTSKESTLVYDGYIGLISPMREFLIAARVYKYILDNDITENVYDAIKDVKFSFDLYGSEQPTIALDTDDMNFTYEGGEAKVKVTTKDEAWTASIEGEGATINPTGGSAGETEVTVTVEPNTGGSRDIKVTFAVASGKSKTLTIHQGASPTNATIREFATEYVKLIDIWKKNVGTVNTTAGIGAQGDNLDVENAHYVPDETTITVGETTFNLADALELASRSYLLLRGYDGNDTKTYGRNLPIPKIDEAYTMDSNIPETHSYAWGSYPYAEPTNGGWFRMVTPEGEFELMKLDILDDYSHRHTNYPQGTGEGCISNFCSYAGDYLPGYTGTCCAKRIMMAYAYFFKYMLDNNLSDAKNISPDQTFEAPLFGDTDGPQPTIRAFAEEYVKLIDIWKNTTGTVNYMSPDGVAGPDFKYDGVPNIENGHYIPLDTRLKIAGVEYTTSEVLDIAIRSYLLLRGYDATDETSVGPGTFAKLDKAYTMDDNFLPVRPIVWGTAPFNETGSTNAEGAVSGNGGNLKMGTPPNGEDKVKVDLLDNFAERNANYPPVKNGNAIDNMAGYTDRLAGYYGCASGHRMLLTYAYFFKYMLDNNLSDATQIPADQTFESYHFGEGVEVESTPNLKGWAQEFVKVLDVWESHVGTVDADGHNNTASGTQFENVRFIPIGEPEGNPYGNAGNQYDPQYEVWNVQYAGKTYTSAEAWDIAIRGLLNLVTAEGEEGLLAMDDRNTPWTFANADTFSTAAVPSASEGCIWGVTPWYEYGETVTYNGEAIEEVGLDFIVKCGSWHIVRAFIPTAGNSSPLGKIGNYQEFGTSSSQLNLDGYAGLISPIRELLIVARIYDYLLENKIDSNVYDAIKNQKFDFDLY